MAVATQLEWTLELLHRLPDDGNKYELVRGELFVTPPPSYGKDLYLDAGVREYWIVDRVEHAITVVRRTGETVVRDRMTWSPEGASSPLEFAVEKIFSP